MLVMNAIKEMVCIVCPLGCRMAIEMDEDRIISIDGNSCPKGAAYAEEEICHPSRVLTTTVKVENGFLCRLPVRTETPISKSSLIKCMSDINSVKVKSPIKKGDIIINNIRNSGVNLIASRSMPCFEDPKELY